MQPQVKLLFDSGAYSAFMKNEVIDINAYAKFVNENRQHVWMPINLDVIDLKDPEKAARMGFDNFNYLLDKGIRSLPVFHEREDIKWLDKMLEVTDYIGISSGNSTGEGAYKSHADWYNLTWNHISDSAGRPVARFHGFGDTAPTSLNTFPWYTVDSSTWYISGARAGTVILNGRRYQARSKVIRSRHFLDVNDPGPQKDAWSGKLREMGLDPVKFMETEMTNDELSIFRCLCTAAYIMDVVETSRDCTTYRGPTSLLYPRSSRTGRERDGRAEPFFVISGSTAVRALPILAKLNIRNVLLSFYYTSKRSWEEDILPYLYDPIGVSQTNKRMKKYWDLLERFSPQEEQVVS